MQHLLRVLLRSLQLESGAATVCLHRRLETLRGMVAVQLGEAVMNLGDRICSLLPIASTGPMRQVFDTRVGGQLHWH